MMGNRLPDHPDPNLLKDPTVTIHVDASDTGWGITSSMMELSGFWYEEQSAPIPSMNGNCGWSARPYNSTVQNAADRISEFSRTILQH
jgi:hypothetical protein